MVRLCVMIAAIAALLISSGCAMPPAPGVRPFWELKESDFLKLRPGMNKSEAEKAVGRPLVSYTFARLQEETWEYDWMDGQIRMKALINFDLRGIVKTYYLVYDQGFYSGTDM